MCTELHGSRLWHRIAGLVPGLTAAIYFGELIFAAVVAIVLLAVSALKPSITIPLFCCGLVAFTLAEYITHRFVLHTLAPVQHGIHHARPREAVDKIFWQIWLAFAVVYLLAGGAVLAGALVAYAWYLFVHYCAHHNAAVLPASLLKHHLDHHRFANRNFGVTTKFWDRVFGTMPR
jgi:sterol desaturase/sphingolipid hydroxylase (fatty acid hydroxylase superfamily)